MIISSMAIFGVAMSFNLFGEGLRVAPDPTSSQ
jgi:ABC-type dipeptide/oligopeptide/nickel transport system permease subunit